MKLLYGQDYARKYTTVADLIPPGKTVVDLCCGDCVIASRVTEKGGTYIGLDINPRFVSWAKSRGIDARIWDARNGEIPKADIICIQSSLYHFMPHERELINRMLASAGEMIIIAEPISNMTTGGSSFFSRLARWMTKVDGQEFVSRHSKNSFEKLVDDLGVPGTVKTEMEREIVAVIPKGAIHGAEPHLSVLSRRTAS